MRWIAWAGLCWLACVSTLDARLQVADLFCDHVVLQRQISVPIWGTASLDSEIIVEYADQIVRTTTDQRGRWQVVLEPLSATRHGRPLSITGDGTSILIQDVVVGEVWLASGQSNMARTMREAEDGRAAIADARQPMLRFFKRPTTGDKRSYQWIACSPDEAGDFSAVAYYFGQHLCQQLDVPIGLIVRAVGGTTIQRWVVPGSERSNPALSAQVAEAERHHDDFARFEAERKKYDKHNPPSPETAKWLAEMGRLSYYRYPTGGLYQRWIRPLQPFALRGVIWYQGEFNNRPGQADDYRHWQTVLIQSWRRDWQQDFPFLFVQMQVLGNATTPLLRESQLKTLDACPNTAMAVICDESAGLHPPRKQLAGDRLAIAARSLVYGEDIPASGPTWKCTEIVDGQAILTFDCGGSRLQAKDGVLKGFFICGENRQFRLAHARITGPDQLTVWCEAIPKPVAVRYAWMNDPREVMSLTNSVGLPASPFRTDTFPETASLHPLLPSKAPTSESAK